MSIPNDSRVGVFAVDAHVIQRLQIIFFALLLPEPFEILLRLAPLLVFGLQTFENDRHGDAWISFQSVDDFRRSVAVNPLDGLFLRHGRLPTELLVELQMRQLLGRHRVHLQLNAFQRPDCTEIHFHDDVQLEAFVFDLVHVFFEDALLRGDGRRFVGEGGKQNAVIVEHFFA